MEFIAGVNADLLIRRGVQEAWLIFSPGTVTVVTDIHGRGAPNNAIAFTAEQLRRVADMIPPETTG